MMENHFTMKHKIVLVRFPFDDFISSKVRPAVCLTDPIGQYRHVVLAFISSKNQSEVEKTDLLIRTEDPDFDRTGLKTTSILRLHRLITVSSNIILRELGVLSKTQQEPVNQKIRVLFKL